MGGGLVVLLCCFFLFSHVYKGVYGGVILTGQALWYCCFCSFLGRMKEEEEEEGGWGYNWVLGIGWI